MVVEGEGPGGGHGGFLMENPWFNEEELDSTGAIPRYCGCDSTMLQQWFCDVAAALSRRLKNLEWRPNPHPHSGVRCIPVRAL